MKALKPRPSDVQAEMLLRLLRGYQLTAFRTLRQTIAALERRGWVNDEGSLTLAGREVAQGLAREKRATTDR